jgi:methylated-DNA-[protein]-cysteine S-methyltransferase
MPQLTILTQIGELTVSEEGGAIVALDWGRGRDQAETPLLRRAAQVLHDYFDGGNAEQDLPLAPAGSLFQQRVWAAMRAIPPGRTRTYGEIAREVGGPARAVGQACGANPIPILIPCHRVTAANGALGGFSGGDGPVTKRWLLDHEGNAAAQPKLPLGVRRARSAGTPTR